MPKRHGYMGKRFERKEKVQLVTHLRCRKEFERALRYLLRYETRDDLRNACHGILVECVPTTRNPMDNRILIRANCTTPKRKDEFERVALRYADAVKKALS